MPLYDYLCEQCGPFTELRPMAEYEAPQDCPGCGSAAPRVLLSAPAIAGMDPSRRKAAATNERSAHAPRRAGGHGPNCGCSAHGGRKKSADAPAAAKGFPQKRPWMIAH